MTRPVRVGVQLWTLRNLCARDLFGTLERVAKTGCRWIEPYDFFGAKVPELARVLADNGLGVATAHVGIERLETRLEREIDDHLALGCTTLVCPWLDETRRAAPDVYERVGDFLDETGARLRERGMRLAYHNHDFEFTDVRDPDGLTRVLSRARPENLGAQLDAYWAFPSGRSAADLARELGPRLVSVHLKDGFPREGRFTPAGRGEVGIADVVRVARELGVRDFVVEQDEHEGDPIDSVAASLGFLRGIGLTDG